MSNTFEKNYGEIGGAVSIFENEDTYINNCTIKENWAIEKGGGVYVQGIVNMLIKNSRITENYLS